MRVRTRGFILFSFAFSSVLSTADVLRIPLQNSNEKTSLESTAHDAVETQNKTSDKTPNRELEKRSVHDFSGDKEEKKGSGDSFYEQNDATKRARLGFTGMRGKKEYTPDDFCVDRLRLEGVHLNKRISKSVGDFAESKRASLGFHGMRGKKAEEYDGEPLDSYSNEEFLINSGLLDEAEDENMEEMLSKRSPYSFQGMRGKKKTAYDFKRTMGFLGMRGKKATAVWDPETNYKRTPHTNFYGIKDKKAQPSGFFGMRGKKTSPDAFFGIKGNFEPSNLYDFSYVNELKDSEAPRVRFRRGITWLNNSKKAKNSFFGMRGKKSTEERLRSSSSTSSD